MKEIILKVPDEFTDEQTEFIKMSAFKQIEAEIKKVLVIPQKDIDACNLIIRDIEIAMNINNEVI